MDQLPNEILQKILHHIKSPLDILSCRLANRKWSALSMQSLQRHHPVLYFDNEEKLTEFLITMDGQLEYLDFPFTKFSILLDSFETFHSVKSLTAMYGRHMCKLIWSFSKWVSFLEALPVGNIEFEDFHSVMSLLRFTPNITHLELNTPCLATKEQGLQLAQVIPQSFPKLEFLRVSCTAEDVNDEDRTAWKHVLEALRTAAPNIHEVVLCPTFANFFSLLPSIAVFSTVKNLKVTDALCLTTVQLLELKKYLKEPFKLSELCTSLVRRQEEEERTPGFSMENSRTVFHDWLETQSQTLKKLEILAEKGIMNYRIPAMQFLESFKLQGGREDYYRPQVPFVTLRTWDFPKLQNVSLQLWTKQMRCIGTEPFPTVETLTIAFFHWDSDHLRIYTHRVFPSIKTLKLNTRGKQLKYFIKRFTLVRHLMLNLMEKDESLFPVDNYDERQFSQILEGSLNERKPPSLAKFTNLKTLEVQATYWVIKTIVYLTKAGDLKSLDCLTLNCGIEVMPVDKKVLNSVHKEVKWI